MTTSTVRRTGNPAYQIGTATIESGQSVSEWIDFYEARLAGLIMPAGWDAAALTFDVSHDGVTPVPLFDATNTEASIAVAAARAYSLSLQTFAPWRYVRFRSGTSALPVVQTAQRVIRIFGEP